MKKLILLLTTLSLLFTTSCATAQNTPVSALPITSSVTNGDFVMLTAINPASPTGFSTYKIAYSNFVYGIVRDKITLTNLALVNPNLTNGQIRYSGPSFSAVSWDSSRTPILFDNTGGHASFALGDPNTGLPILGYDISTGLTIGDSAGIGQAIFSTTGARFPGTTTIAGALKITTGAVNTYVLTTDGAGNASWNPNTGIAGGSRKLFAATSSQQYQNTTTSTTLFAPGSGTLTLTPSQMAVGTMLHIHFEGKCVLAGGGNTTINISLGATALYNNNNISFGNNPTALLEADIYITFRSIGATGVVLAQGNIGLYATTANPLNVNATTATVDTTVNETLDVQLAMSLANAGNVVQINQALVEFFP